MADKLSEILADRKHLYTM